VYKTDTSYLIRKNVPGQNVGPKLRAFLESETSWL